MKRWNIIITEINIRGKILWKNKEQKKECGRIC